MGQTRSTRRQQEGQRLLSEVQASRERQNLLLVRDYRQAAERLQSAYNNALPAIASTTEGLFDALVPSYPRNYDPQSEAIRAALERFKAGIERDLAGLSATLADQSASLQTSGAINGYRAGIANLTSGGVRVAFNSVTAQNIVAGIDYVDSEPFRAAVGGLAEYHAQQAVDIVLSAIAQGQNPRITAQAIAGYFKGSQSPMVDALRLTRTTQIYSARNGTQQIYKQTGVSQWIWSANLGNPRTCLACIAMHGTLHPVDELLNDHFNGRCAACPVTPRWSELGLAGQELQVETGVDWFNRQDANTQIAAMGPQLFEAWQKGKFTFSPDAVVGTYSNPIFGIMRHRNTNAEILSVSNS